MRWQNGKILTRKLDRIHEQGLFRQLRSWDARQGLRLTIGNQTYLNACSNDYLGLSQDATIKETVIQALHDWGYGAGASRLVSANNDCYQKLEQSIADWIGQPAALVFASGYAANLGTISALVGRNDCVFCDRHCHASLYDGVALSGAKLVRFPHNNLDALQQLLETTPLPADGKRMLMVESLYSMDGDWCDLPTLYELADKYDALLYVDEAHALGVLGNAGKGLTDHLRCANRIDVQIGTFGKAFGGLGAFVACDKLLRDYLVNRCRSLIFSTALPPALLAGNLVALQRVQNDTTLIASLRQTQSQLWQAVKTLLPNNPICEASPIIPLVIGDNTSALECSKAWFQHGVFVQAIRPPTVPTGTARLRLTASAGFSSDDIKLLVNTLQATQNFFMAHC